MIALLCLFLTVFVAPFKSKRRLEAENAALRHQLSVLRRKCAGASNSRTGIACSWSSCIDGFPSVLKAVTIIRPETLIRWHRAGFRRYWRWKSCSLGGRPKIAAEPGGRDARLRGRDGGRTGVRAERGLLGVDEDH